MLNSNGFQLLSQSKQPCPLPCRPSSGVSAEPEELPDGRVSMGRCCYKPVFFSHAKPGCAQKAQPFCPCKTNVSTAYVCPGTRNSGVGAGHKDPVQSGSISAGRSVLPNHVHSTGTFVITPLIITTFQVCATTSC